MSRQHDAGSTAVTLCLLRGCGESGALGALRVASHCNLAGAVQSKCPCHSVLPVRKQPERAPAVRARQRLTGGGPEIEPVCLFSAYVCNL